MAIEDKLNALASNMEAEFDSLEKSLSEIGSEYGDTIEKLAANRPMTLGDPLTFINICTNISGVPNNLVLSLNKVGAPYDAEIEYSTDGVTWTDYAWNAGTGAGTQITLTKVGEFVQFRNKAAWTITGSVNLGKDVNNYYQFKGTGRAYACGNVLSLLGKFGAPSYRQNTLPNYCFYRLFAKPDSGTASWLHNAPAIGGGVCSTGAYSCAYMFEGSMIYMAGDVDVANIGTYGCAGMFKDCTYLYRAPEIRAQAIGSYGCAEMFSGCAKISAPPSRLGGGGTYAFRQMFYNCILLKTSPILSTGVAEGIYEGMFYGCTALGSAQPAVLPAATLATGCYKQMYRGCTGVAVSPLILAESTDVTSCMEEMFYGCTGLNHVRTAATALGTGYSQSWLYGVASTGVIECHASLGLSTRGADTAPAGWTVVRTDKPQSDWDESDSTISTYIMNKPAIPSGGGDEYVEPQSAYGIGAGKWKITSTLLSNNYGSITIELQSGEKAYLLFDLESNWGSGNETVAEISCSYYGTFFLGTKEKQTRFTIPGKYYYIIENDIENDGTYYRLLNRNGQLIQYLDYNGTHGGIRTRMHEGTLEYSPIPFSNDYIEMPYGGIVSPVVANGDLGIMFSETDSGQTIDLTTNNPYLPYGTYVLPSSRNPVLIVKNGNTINALGELNLQNDPVIITIIGDNQSHVYLENNQTDLLAPSSPWAAQIDGDNKMVRLLTWCQPYISWGWIRFWKDANDTSVTPTRVYARIIMNLPYQ